MGKQVYEGLLSDSYTGDRCSAWKFAGEFSDTIIETRSRIKEEVSDDALVQAVLGGDESAFEQLFERHKTRVARVAGNFFNRPEKIEEIAQEAFTKAYFALKNYAPQPDASFAAWLSRITMNCCYDELRRAQRRPHDGAKSLGDDEVHELSALLSNTKKRDAEAHLITRDLADKLLAQLSPEDRWALTLLEVEEMSVKEISELTNWSIAKVKVRMHRARLSLRQLLKDFM
ncbi:MAG: sigma-70 family RNA polymerase sigma factor [Acidobacteriota bacterium]